MQNLLKDIKVTRVMNAVAAGTSVQNSSVLDMSGWDGVVFIAALGALTATQVTGLKGQQGQASNLSDAADLIGTAVGPLADGDSNKCLALDIYRPQERYVRCVVTRGTANAVIDGVIAIQYRGSKAPAVQDTSIAFAESHVSPAEGTA
ncbi:MAG: hypothetical protein H8K10_10655 [Nitrospira sp.]|nr:hypothetical protein [Nitrospira sp.]